MHVLADDAAQHALEARHHAAEFDAARGEGLSPADGEQLARQCGAFLGGLEHRVQPALNGMVRGQRPARHLAEAVDNAQQIVEVVSDAAGQPADGFHLLRLSELRPRRFQVRLGLLHLGEIADHDRAFLGATDGERAHREAQRHDRAVAASTFCLPWSLGHAPRERVK